MSYLILRHGSTTECTHMENQLLFLHYVFVIKVDDEKVDDLFYVLPIKRIGSFIFVSTFVQCLCFLHAPSRLSSK